MKTANIMIGFLTALALSACAIHYPPAIRRGEIFDLQFIDTMSAHHQNGIEMARMAESRAQHAELKPFARKIVDARESEIGQMKGWREQWYAGMPANVNKGMPGMEDYESYMSKLSAAAASEFDFLFINMMTLDHAGTVTMANEALSKADHPEIKKLANQIISEQREDLEQMSKWRTAWSSTK